MNEKRYEESRNDEEMIIALERSKDQLQKGYQIMYRMNQILKCDFDNQDK